MIMERQSVSGTLTDLNNQRRLSAQEDIIAFFRRENFKTYIKYFIVLHRFVIFQTHTHTHTHTHTLLF